LILDDGRSLYDVLELTPDASPQEIRAAYLRAKSAYKKDSVALYTLISEEETDELLRQIEDAYQVLSNPERRKVYDRSHGTLDASSSSHDPFRAPMVSEEDPIAEVVSIDRVPPMENADISMLVPPTTDFGTDGPAKSSQKSEQMMPVSTAKSAKAPARKEPGPLHSEHEQARQNDAQIQQEIQQEVEWRGTFLRRVREARSVPIEELSDFTKISRTYLQAIEEENFDRLPATVFLRGFLIQLCKYLKIPQDKMVAPYLARCTEARAKKEKSR
jgi:hypothetical protein